MWVRGLKLPLSGHKIDEFWSHPVWVRGLKPLVDIPLILLFSVAPRVGAWIETNVYTCNNQGIAVAPRVGAWIETSLQSGLCDYIGVAPRVGAWIETRTSKSKLPLP